VTLAFIGETRRASALADGLSHEFPEDTFVQSCYLPTIRGALALKSGDSARALHELGPAAPYELGVAGGLLSIYIRGLAYLQAGDGSHATIEFKKIIDHPGVVLNAPIGSLALLQLGRAHVLSGQSSVAKTEYQGFLRRWQNADPNIPVLTEATAEVRKLQ
jgi:hypothetical protein